MRRSRPLVLGLVLLVTGCSRTGQAPVPTAPAAGRPQAVPRPKLEPRRVTGAPAEPTPVTTSDGATLAADWRPARPAGDAGQAAAKAGAGEPRGGLVLLPMLGHTHQDYAAAAEFFSGIGWASLAVSLRGHGQSKAPDGKPYDQFSDEEWRAAGNDVTAAVAALREKVPGKPIVLLGASIGANLSLRYAAEHADSVAGLILLSPGLDYHGVGIADSLAPLKARPMLLVCSSDDNYSFASCAKLQVAHDPAAMSYLQYDGRDHGTDLLAHQTELLARIDTWLGKLSG